MELITLNLSEVINKELSNQSNDIYLNDFVKILENLEKAGVVKKPQYELPQVDTLGRNLYLGLNKHN